MDRSAYDAFVALDRLHFWRVGKRALVLETLRRTLGGQRNLRILDIGGACSLATQALSEFGDVTCVEPDEQTARMARDALGVSSIHGSLPADFPTNPPCELVTLLDVLEHVEEEEQSLRAIFDALAPGGWLVCSVPAYMWLWSEHDDALHHKRRYTRTRLADRFREAGFEIQRLTYYTCLLFPILVAQRTLKNVLRRRGKPPRYAVTLPPRPVNALFGAVMRLERWLLRHLNLPYGSALLVVGQKPNP